MLDLHCHILPGVDDGARSLRESAEMLEQARLAGVDTLVATPHVRRADTDIAPLRDKYRQLRPLAARFGIRLLWGCELYADVLAALPPERLREFTIEGSPFLLLEMPDHAFPPQWEYWISDLCGAGLRPIVAHVERNTAVQRDPDKLPQLLQLGCLLQVDAESLARRAPCRVIHRMCAEGVPFVLASDAHRADFYPLFRRATRLFPGAAVGRGFLSRPVLRRSAPIPWPRRGFERAVARGIATVYR